VISFTSFSPFFCVVFQLFVIAVDYLLIAARFYMFIKPFSLKNLLQEQKCGFQKHFFWFSSFGV